MGEFAGELPGEIISFHCLENDLKDGNTEGTENFPVLPQRSESVTVIVTETEDSLLKSLAVMKVTAVSKDDLDVVTQDVRFAKQGCLLCSSDEGSVALERFLHEKLDALSGEGLEKIVEVDPSGMLALLEKSNVGHRDNVQGVVERKERLKLGDMDSILRSELVERSSGAKKRFSTEEDVTSMAGTPPQSVMFNIYGKSTLNESTVGGLEVWQMWAMLSLVHSILMERSTARQKMSL